MAWHSHLAGACGPAPEGSVHQRQERTLTRSQAPAWRNLAARCPELAIEHPSPELPGSAELNIPGADLVGASLLR
eukprot:1224526-Prymnesium_polylepis.5